MHPPGRDRALSRAVEAMVANSNSMHSRRPTMMGATNPITPRRMTVLGQQAPRALPGDFEDDESEESDDDEEDDEDEEEEEAPPVSPRASFRGLPASSATMRESSSARSSMSVHALKRISMRFQQMSKSSRVMR